MIRQDPAGRKSAAGDRERGQGRRGAAVSNGFPRGRERLPY